MGSIGEFALLNQQERLTLIRESRQFSPLNMVANVSSNSVSNIIELTEEAWKNNFDAVMLLPPYYYGQSRDQLFSYFCDLDKRIGGRWFAYNFPARTGCDLTPELVGDLARKLDNFIGIKDTVDCLSHTRSIINETRQTKKDFSVFSGYDEYLIPNLMAGGSGVISGLNNIVPERFSTAVQAWSDQNLKDLINFQQYIGELMGIYSISNDFVTTIKTAVSRVFGSVSYRSRSYGSALDALQIQAIDKLFSHKNVKSSI
jgi:4-hydroxy-tetrahydrodipicolinate synthase